MEAIEEAQYENIPVEDVFLTLLDNMIHDAKDMLKERFEWICS
jgi:hypothetical protein